MTILADTGPLYALVDPSDQYHARAVRELRAITESGVEVAVTHGALCESYTLILRRLGGSTARRWLSETMEGAVVLGPDASDLPSAVAILSHLPDQSITLVDALAAAAGRRLALAVWTFDRHFTAMGARILAMQ